MASVHVCLAHSNSPSFTPSSSSFPSPASLLSTSPARKPCLPVTLCFSFLQSPRSCCSDSPWAFPSLSSWQPKSLLSSSLFSLLCVCHSHARVTRPAAPPASSCSRPSFKTFPPSQPQSLLSIKVSIFPCSHLTLCLDGAIAAVSWNPWSMKKNRKEEDAAFYPRTSCLRAQNTNATPTALQLFFDDLFIAWQAVSSKKQW